MAIDLPKNHRCWRIRFTTPSGKRIQRSTRTTDKRQAQELHDKLKAQYWRKDQLNEKPQRLWQEAIVQWVKECTAKKSLPDDRDKIKWLNKYLRGLALNKIDRDLIEHIADDKSKEGVSDTTVNRYLEFIRAILRRAKYEWGWLEEVPVIRMRKMDNKRIRFISREEANRLIAVLPEHLADMTAFSLATGLRKSNVTGLKWAEVDLLKRHALIHPDQSKTRKAIPVPLNTDAIEILRKQLGRHSTYVFTYKKRSKEKVLYVPVQEVNTKAWHDGLEKAGITNFRWHDLRHTWASWHVQSGTSLHELQQMGGWTSHEMVLRYAHLASEHLQAAAERITGAKLVKPELRVVGKNG